MQLIGQRAKNVFVLEGRSQLTTTLTRWWRIWMSTGSSACNQLKKITHKTIRTFFTPVFWDEKCRRIIRGANCTRRLGMSAPPPGQCAITQVPNGGGCHPGVQTYTWFSPDLAPQATTDHFLDIRDKETGCLNAGSGCLYVIVLTRFWNISLTRGKSKMPPATNRPLCGVLLLLG